MKQQLSRPTVPSQRPVPPTNPKHLMTPSAAHLSPQSHERLLQTPHHQLPRLYSQYALVATLRRLPEVREFLVPQSGLGDQWDQVGPGE